MLTWKKLSHTGMVRWEKKSGESVKRSAVTSREFSLKPCVPGRSSHRMNEMKEKKAGEKGKKDTRERERPNTHILHIFAMPKMST